MQMSANGYRELTLQELANPGSLSMTRTTGKKPLKRETLLGRSDE
jgi:hypothetical protein